MRPEYVLNWLSLKVREATSAGSNCPRAARRFALAIPG